MKVDPTDLVGTKDIADMASVSLSAVSNWKARDVGFPRPIITVNQGATDLYLRQHVEQFLAYRRRKENS